MKSNCEHELQHCKIKMQSIKPELFSLSTFMLIGKKTINII